MKRTFTIFIATCIAVLSLSLNACGSIKPLATAQNGKLQIVTTIFPEYDYVRQIVGNADSADITLLLDNGVDLHSYQPTAADILKISTCDVFIYVGGESDAWVEDALKQAKNKNQKVINLLDILGTSVKEEEVVEGMQTEAEDDHEKDDHHEKEHHHAQEAEEDEIEYDEHVWLSLKNAAVICNAITNTLADADTAHADIYKENGKNYIKKLNDLDEEYKNMVTNSTKKTVLFGDRFPFRYLTDDYGLRYYAAFVGCSAETEASFETITFLSEKVDAEQLHTVLTIEHSDKKIAETIVKNTKAKNQQILTLDSMQSTTTKENSDYLSIMTANLEVLKKALQ